MEAVSVYSLIILISLCVISFFIGRLTGQGREDNERLETELEQNKEELKKYRSEVTSHFQETAHRVNALTENYRSVYEHLAQGAQQLCDKNDAPPLINELNPEPILGGKTVNSSEAEQEELMIEPEAKSDLVTDEKETEKTDDKQNNTEDSTTAKEVTETSDLQETQDSKEEKSTDAEHEEKVSDKPVLAADKRDEPEEKKDV